MNKWYIVHQSGSSKAPFVSQSHPRERVWSKADSTLHLTIAVILQHRGQ